MNSKNRQNSSTAKIGYGFFGVEALKLVLHLICIVNFFVVSLFRQFRRGTSTKANQSQRINLM